MREDSGVVPGHPLRPSQLDVRVLAAIFAGGMLGALARTRLEESLPHAPDAWPWATLIVNVAGAFLLGYAVTRLTAEARPSTYRRPFIATGVCGALTTFSTMQLELLRMLDAGNWTLALGYTVASVVAGLGAVLLAIALARRTGAGAAA